VYSNSIISEDYDISSSLFDKNSIMINLRISAPKRVTEVYNKH
jgi:two-component system phosphate regulon sensor histidine kinase PhoR